MSHFLDRLKFFSQKHEPFADGHGVLTEEDRKWENAYRSRWQHDKSGTFHSRCELYRFVQLESLCKKRPDYLGNPADRLSPYPPRLA